MDYIICSYVIKLISQSLFPRHVDSVCSASSNVASNHSIFHPRCHAILFKCCSCSRCGFATGCFCITNHLQQVKLQKQRDINSLFHPAKQEPQFQHRYSVCMYIRDGTICIYRIYSVYSYLDTVYTTHTISTTSHLSTTGGFLRYKEMSYRTLDSVLYVT